MTGEVLTVSAGIDVTRGATIKLAAAHKASAGATLIVHGLRANPGGSPLYEVTLMDARGRSAAVGLINFFNASASGASTMPPQRFDASSALAALDGAAIAVTIGPISGVSGVTPAIAPDSRVSVERIELVAR